MEKTRDERIGNKRIVELVLTEEEIAAAKEHKDFRSRLLKRKQEREEKLGVIPMDEALES